MRRREVTLRDLAATRHLAAELVADLHVGDVVALRGELGAGKSELARAILQELGVQGDVPSPTFTLIQLYDIGGRLITHFDLYRLNAANELDELGWDDAIADSLALIEWPERAGDRLPQKRIDINLSIRPDGSRLCVIEDRRKPVIF
jgi:tRNA threonylcarbamoyl adenosine modification protein YjeE